MTLLPTLLPPGAEAGISGFLWYESRPEMGGSFYGSSEVVTMPKKEDNLKPIRTLSKEEAKRRGSKGGKASAASRRRRKTLRENMELLLGLPVSLPEDYNVLAELGVDQVDTDNAMLLTAGLFQKAKSGDVAACKEVREWIGEEADTNSGVQIVDDY